MQDVAVVIPALNEAGNIFRLVSEVLATPVPEARVSVIVVDNGSTDATAEEASLAGAQVVFEPRRGYGYACSAGAAAAVGAEFLAFLDGDYSSLPSELPAMLETLLSGQADLCLGSRERGGIAPGAMPPQQRFGNRLASWLMSRLYGLSLTDVGPYRAIRRSLLASLDMHEMTYGWTVEMMVKAARQRARIVEVPVRFYPRQAGRSKVSGTLCGTILAAWFILGVTLRYAWRWNATPWNPVFNPATLLAGAAMTTCFAVIAALPELGGANLIPFLAYFLIASVAYWAAVLRLEGGHPSLWMIWVFAVVFRLVLLAAAPSLSSDVYRYLWDGHLLSRGINPYALPVNSPILDAYTTPLRGLVNHNEMASPYLPAAQLLFAAVEKIAPQNPKAFQVLAVTLDLSTGWLLMDLLRMLGLPRRRVLIYLWNPLVIVEFAVGAHLDAWMIFLTVAAFWLVIWAGLGGSHQRGLYLASAVPMAMATLTKAVPVLLAPLFLRRWGWKGVAAFMAIVVGACALFAAGAGWGLVGPLDGTGLFGAVRIFIQRWNYNSGLYHSLEVFLTGFHTPGAVPLEPAYQASIRLARVVTTACMGIATLGAGIWAWRLDGSPGGNYQRRSLNLLRLAVVSLGAYLWFTHTVHPWYVTIILPFIIFLFPAPGEKTTGWRFAYPWLYYSCAVAVSYLTYIDPQNLREFYLVRRIEYLPFYLLLVWAAWPSAYQGLVWIWANGMRWGRMKRR